MTSPSRSGAWDAAVADAPMTATTARARRVLVGVIALGLAAVIIAPSALSSRKLVVWAGSPRGLGLGDAWRYVPLVALDATALLCIGFMVYSAIRRESAGAFALLTWGFAGGSAVANYRYGLRTPAPDDAVFFAAMSLAGPALFHLTVHRLRRWLRISQGEYTPARARFGLRWLPGVGFRETLQAWKASVRAGISRPEVAIALVRERRLLAGLEPAAAVRYAIGASGAASLQQVWVWLADRGRTIDHAWLAEVLAELSPTPSTTLPGDLPEPPAELPAPPESIPPTLRLAAGSDPPTPAGPGTVPGAAWEASRDTPGAAPAPVPLPVPDGHTKASATRAWLQESRDAGGTRPAGPEVAARYGLDASAARKALREVWPASKPAPRTTSTTRRRESA